MEDSTISNTDNDSNKQQDKIDKTVKGVIPQTILTLNGSLKQNLATELEKTSPDPKKIEKIFDTGDKKVGSKSTSSTTSTSGTIPPKQTGTKDLTSPQTEKPKNPLLPDKNVPEVLKEFISYLF